MGIDSSSYRDYQRRHRRAKVRRVVREALGEWDMLLLMVMILAVGWAAIFYIPTLIIEQNL